MFEHLKDHLPLLQYVHLLWGFGLFVALALWAYRPRAKRSDEDHASLIFRDDDTASDQRGHHGAEQ